MARIEKTIDIDRSPGDVWAVVGDVGATRSYEYEITESPTPLEHHHA